VFGESAGAGSVLSLLSMPAAEGLFHGAIVQSGATDLVLDRERATHVAELFANEAGVAPGDLGALRSLSDQQILDAQLRTAAALRATVGLMPFHPVADGKVMPLDWLESARAGTSRDVALVIGTTRDEMALFDSFDPSLATLDDDGLRRRVAAGAHPAPDRLLDAYRVARPDATPAQLWSAITTDVAMWLPALHIAEAHAAHQPDTWMYRFDWPAADPALGACHGIDIPFPFDTVERAGWERFLADASTAHELARAQQAAWAAFARTGEPATGALPRWPRFSPASRATMVLAREPHVEHDPAGSVRAAWSAASNLPA
jgi:para-nitrobenzyl esterase